ncbi:MAG TPA: hypothetical protein VI076_09445 [Actinopolymorphaceae bacterium]
MLRARLERLRWAGLLSALMVTFTLVVGVQPASAHSSYLCSYMPTEIEYEEVKGGILKLDNSDHNHTIGWTFMKHYECPGKFYEGELEIAVEFLEPTRTGCTSTPKGRTSWRRFNEYSLSNVLASSVKPGTCYRLVWRALTYGAINKPYRGAIWVNPG